MLKKINLAVIFLLLLTVYSFAQLKEKDNLLGPSLGFWPSGSAPTLGANFESQLAQLGIGTISLGGVFRYTTFRNDFPFNNYWNYKHRSKPPAADHDQDGGQEEQCADQHDAGLLHDTRPTDAQKARKLLHGLSLGPRRSRHRRQVEPDRQSDENRRQGEDVAQSGKESTDGVPRLIDDAARTRERRPGRWLRSRRLRLRPPWKFRPAQTCRRRFLSRLK